jgi:hypothetical protein
MVKRLYREQSSMDRTAALEYERTRPYRLPGDSKSRRQQWLPSAPGTAGR